MYFKKIVQHVLALDFRVSDRKHLLGNARTTFLMVAFAYWPWGYIVYSLVPELGYDNLITRLPFLFIGLILFATTYVLNLKASYIEFLSVGSIVLVTAQQVFWAFSSNFSAVYVFGIMIVSAVATTLLLRVSVVLLYVVFVLAVVAWLFSRFGWSDIRLFYMFAIATTLSLSGLMVSFRIKLINRLVDEEIALKHQLYVSQNLSTAALSAAHDLRAPIGALKIMANNPELIEKNTQLLKDALSRINVLADNLLHLGRYSKAGKDSKDIASSKEIADILTFIASLMNTTGSIKIDLDLANLLQGSEQYKIDPLSLERVVTNLIKNAIEASPEGAPVKVAVSIVDKNLSIKVIDQGYGIPPATQKKLFKAEITTKGENGNGLGLVSSKKLLDSFGASIRYSPNESRGSVFEVNIAGL